MGPALGDGGGEGAARHAQERRDPRRYTGINVLILWGAVIEHGFAGQSWLTFRQALEPRWPCPQGRARHDRRLCRPVHSRMTNAGAPRETGEEAQAIPFLKRFTVFNTGAMRGLPDEMMAVAPPVETEVSSCRRPRR